MYTTKNTTEQGSSFRQNRLNGCFGSIFVMAVGSVFLGVGLAMGGFGDYFGSQDWKETSGLVESAEYIERDGSDGTMYGAKITYRYYDSSEEQHTSDRIYFGFDGNMTTSNSGTVREIMDKYPVGTEVTVYYDPDDPDSAVIERRFDTWLAICAGVGGVTMLGGLLGLVYNAGLWVTHA